MRENARGGEDLPENRGGEGGPHRELRHVLRRGFPELGSSLKRVSLFAKGQNPPAPLPLTFSHQQGTLSGGQLKLSVESAGTGNQDCPGARSQRVRATEADKQGGLGGHHRRGRTAGTSPRPPRPPGRTAPSDKLLSRPAA